MISSQRYFEPGRMVAEKMSGTLPLSLRSNQKINAALRAAYRKFDRTEETEKLLRRHLR